MPLTPQKVQVDGMPMVSWAMKDGKMTYSILMKDQNGSYIDLQLTEAQYAVLKKY